MNKSHSAPASAGMTAETSSLHALQRPIFGQGRPYVARVAFAALMLIVMLGAAPDRPRDPWVFRCVLDKNPRMVVIALHENLWVAYDATTCSLRQVWEGGVKFDGAVYTTVHGPQPTSVGDALFRGPEDSVWTVHSAVDGLPKSTPADVLWRGYRIEDDTVWLQYEFTEPGLAERFEESVEAIVEGGQPVGIVRRFRQIGGAPGVTGRHWMTLGLAQGPQTALSHIGFRHSLGSGELIVDTDDDAIFAPQITAAGEFEIRMYFRNR